jgi:CRISPR-associated protein Csb2
MSMAAAWFETEPPNTDDQARNDWTAEGEALRWIETLGDPQMILPAVDGFGERTTVSYYVPVNDRAGPAGATLQSAPALTRSKQARTFPRIWVGHSPCALHWPDAAHVATHLAALERLCPKVTRIGHSSSLVAMRAMGASETLQQGGVHLVPDELHAEVLARSLSKGTLDMLRDRFGEQPRGRHAALCERIDDLKNKRKSTTGKGAQSLKAEIDEQITRLETELSTTPSRPPVRPITGLWSGYRRAIAPDPSPSIARSLFDPDILVLTQVDGPAIPVVSTLTVTTALRKAILSQCPQPVPAWVSGHDADSQPLRDGGGHLALVPMPYVGNEHADGHLLGVALVFPQSVSYKERGRVLGKLLVNERGQPRDLPLRLGPLGVWTVRKRDWQETRRTLQPAGLTAFPNGATTWASVSPVVLDRFPKADRLNPQGRAAWEDEVRQIIAGACVRIGLPAPDGIDIDSTSWLLGSPRAFTKRRPLRGQPQSEHDVPAAVGEGFPPFPPKGTGAPRPQVHVWLQFARPVVGPVILGAGRYLGYGLCKPMRGARQ